MLSVGSDNESQPEADAEEVAIAFEYVERGEVLAALKLADRICAMPHRLSK